VWDRSYTGEAFDSSADVTAALDGGCFVVGRTTGFGAMGSDIRVMRLDVAGEIVWQKRFGGAGDEEAYAVEGTADGGLLVSGRVRQGTVWNGLLMRLDSAGDLANCPSGVTWATAALENAVEFDQDGPIITPNYALETGVIPVPTTTSVATPMCFSSDIGTSICLASPNSTGAPAEIQVWGSEDLSDDALTLVAASLPSGQFGVFFTGMGTSTFVPPGSQGTLCLSGAEIFRFADDVQNSGAAGAFGLSIDVDAVPGLGAIIAGETWGFQAWFRDSNPQPTSNLTGAVAVTFH
jgi:hypothetical protein